MLTLRRACRLWAAAPPEPTTSTAGSSKKNEEVENDLLFFEGQPIYVFVDRWQRFHYAQLTANRTLESMMPCFDGWILLCTPMEKSLSGEEGCLMGDEVSLYLGRRGIERVLVPKEAHLALIDVAVEAVPAASEGVDCV